MNMDVLAVNVTHYEVFDFLKDGETKEQLLNRANNRKEENIRHYKEILSETEGESFGYFKKCLEREEKIEYRIMSFDEFIIGQRTKLLGNGLKEITEEQWEDALNVLPPLHWTTIDGVEMFCMSEMYTGTYTTQYAKYKGKYYCKIVDCTDKSTWINHILIKMEDC